MANGSEVRVGVRLEMGCCWPVGEIWREGMLEAAKRAKDEGAADRSGFVGDTTADGEDQLCGWFVVVYWLKGKKGKGTEVREGEKTRTAVMESESGIRLLVGRGEPGEVLVSGCWSVGLGKRWLLWLVWLLNRG